MPHGNEQRISVASWLSSNVVTIEEEVKVILVGNSLRIAIPKTICKALHIEKGQTLQVKTTNGDILISRLGMKKRG